MHRLSLLPLCALVACGSPSSLVTEPEGGVQPVLVPFADGTFAGAPTGQCLVPRDALAADTSGPRHVVGNGTPQSCTAEAVRAAVAQGGFITFDCGTQAHTIVMDAPAKVRNDAHPDVVLDGQGKVTLSGGGTQRILYMNTCDKAQVWTTPHCQDQDHPRLTVRNLTFRDGNARAYGTGIEGGGGAIWARGGRLRIVHCRFYGNVGADTGADVGGGAVRAFDQSQGLPLHVVNSTFGADGDGNEAANGGAISSIGVDWSLWNSLFVGNRAVGNGGNPAQAGTPGGGSGGAVYNDGNELVLSACGSVFERNSAVAFGSAIFFVSNDHKGVLRLRDVRVSGNVGGGWHTLPGIAMHSDTRQEIVNSVLENGSL